MHTHICTQLCKRPRRNACDSAAHWRVAVGRLPGLSSLYPPSVFALRISGIFAHLASGRLALSVSQETHLMRVSIRGKIDKSERDRSEAALVVSPTAQQM